MDKMQRIQETIRSMTVREKALALTGKSMFKLGGYQDIPDVYFLDGGTGANYAQMITDCFYRIYQTGQSGTEELINDRSGIADKMLRLMNIGLGKVPAESEQEQAEADELQRQMQEYTPNGLMPGCFPPGMLLGATWNPDVIYQMGVALGKEADYYKIDVLLGTPNVNIHRDPLNGRLFEGYSEDPCLVAKLAPALVKGVQSQGIAADVKHFAANNQETDRRFVNEHIPVRALHEIYFPGFKACVQEGSCKTVMSAYNAINGSYCAMNPWLLTEVLRDKWGFNGYVVSDWGAVYDQVEGLRAGNDVDMPGPRNVDAIVQAVENGILEESVLDRSLERFWTTMLSLPCIKDGHKQTQIDREGSKKAAYDCVKEGMVLLKNRKNTLPLSVASTVSIYGSKSKKLIESGSGSAGILTDQTSNIYDSIVRILGADKVIEEQVTEQTNAVIVTVGSNGQEGFDRKNLDIDEKDQRYLSKAVADAKQYNKPVVLVLNVCGPVDLIPYEADVDAIICLFIPGMEGGHACADLITGKFSPSGKLPLTFPKRYRDCPSSGNFPGWNKEVWYAEGIFVGYRYYDYRNVEPLYPFGFGLSYTSFNLTEAALSGDTLNIDENGAVTVTVTIKNTGAMEGKEVVQLYIGQENPTLVKPPKELKHFQKVFLHPGQEQKLEFTLTKADFASFDPIPDDWTVEPGQYSIYLGTSSRDIFHKLPLQLVGYDPYGFNENTTMGSFANTKGALEVLCSFLPAGCNLTYESIAASILYQPMGPLKEYWRIRIEPLLPGTPEEKQARYVQMLAAVNRFK